MYNPENGMRVCAFCQTDVDEHDIELVDGKEEDLETGIFYDVQIPVCPDCAEKVRKEKEEHQ